MCGLHSRAGSFRHQKPCARQSQSHRFCCLHSSVSRLWGGLVYTPALLSPSGFSSLRLGIASKLALHSLAASVPPASASCRCAPLAEASGRRGGSRSGCWRRHCRFVRWPNRQRLRRFHPRRRCGVVPLFVGPCLFASGVVLRFCVSARSLIRAVPARAPEAVCLTHKLAVFAGVWEPEVSQTLRRQSPSATSRCQTASEASAPLASLVPRPWSLADSQPPPHYPSRPRSRQL